MSMGNTLLVSKNIYKPFLTKFPMDKIGGWKKNAVFLLYIVIGVWFINEPFQMFPFPEVTEWWIFLAGIMLMCAGFAVVFTVKRPGMGMPIAPPPSIPKNMNINLQRRRQAKARRPMAQRR